jgi:hypothetical protein
MQLATKLNLKSHPALVGRSSIADNTTKYDYFTQCSVSIAGIERKVLFRVGGPGEPVLFCLDLIFAWGMKADFVNGKVAITDCTEKGGIVDSGLAQIDWNEQLTANGIEDKDLVPLANLPPAKKSYKALVDAGQGYHVVDLGSSFEVIHKCTKRIVDFGSTN